MKRERCKGCVHYGVLENKNGKQSKIGLCDYWNTKQRGLSYVNDCAGHEPFKELGGSMPPLYWDD